MDANPQPKIESVFGLKAAASPASDGRHSVAPAGSAGKPNVATTIARSYPRHQFFDSRQALHHFYDLGTSSGVFMGAG
jgi:hypothetical protein